MKATQRKTKSTKKWKRVKIPLHVGSQGSAEGLLVIELSELIREGRVRVIGLVRQELLSGVKTSEQYEKLKLYLRLSGRGRSTPLIMKKRPRPAIVVGRRELRSLL
jgi:hypothetical protein